MEAQEQMEQSLELFPPQNNSNISEVSIKDICHWKDVLCMSHNSYQVHQWHRIKTSIQNDLLDLETVPFSVR